MKKLNKKSIGKNILKASDATPAADVVRARQDAAAENMIHCRATSGIKLSASEPWESGKSVSYIYAPGGITTISAGFRKNESITCTVCVDEDTAKDLQDSFDFIAATEKQEPYADEDHEAKKATLRFPPGKVEFTYGTHRGEEGVIVKGAEPTSYGAEAVNGKTYASWSPEFATDADYSAAKCKKGHWTFPDGVRGSASNPARLIAVNFVMGALTNKPAFRNMPPVKAKLADVPVVATDTTPAVVKAAGTSEGVKKSWQSRRGDAYGASEIANKLSVAALNAGEKAGEHSGAKEEHMAAAEAHHAAADKHGEAAGQLHMEGKKDFAAHHEDYAKTHEQAASHHIGWARGRYDSGVATHENPATKATATPPAAPAEDDTVKAAAEAAAKAAAAPDPMAAIYARETANHEAVDKLAARVPATATRAEMETLYARVGANGQTR